MDENRTIEIDRICTLNKGDRVLYCGIWRIVTGKNEKVIKYCSVNRDGGTGTIPANNKAFVEIQRVVVAEASGLD